MGRSQRPLCTMALMPSTAPYSTAATGQMIQVRSQAMVTKLHPK